jgi:hypothetical protein
MNISLNYNSKYPCTTAHVTSQTLLICSSGHTAVPLELRNSRQFPFKCSPMSSRHGPRTVNTALYCCMVRSNRKHMSHVRLRVHWSVNSTGRGADDIEKTASFIVACWTVFTELLPGNALIKSVTI